MKNKSPLIISILIPLAVGAVSAYLSRGGMMIFKTLNKPPLTPPSWLFPVVWTVLYILMGISSYLIYGENSEKTPCGLRLYGLQLAFNFMWSILFFRFMLFIASFLWLVIMIGIIIAMIICFYKIRKSAAIINIPYLIWCLFAAYLNFGVYLLN